MSKKIIKYKMYKSERGNLITPFWIKDGGYFPHDNFYIGIIDDELEYYVPKTNKSGGDLEEFNNNQFISYIESLPLVFEGMTNTEAAENWLAAKGLD